MQRRCAPVSTSLAREHTSPQSTVPSPASTRPGLPSTGKRSPRSSNPATMRSSSKLLPKPRSLPQSSLPHSLLPSASPRRTAPNDAFQVTTLGKSAPITMLSGSPHKSAAPSPYHPPSPPPAPPRSQAPTASPPTPHSSAKTLL